MCIRDSVTWGLSGFPLGTDHFGRDMLVRIINGGRVTMLVGAIAVVIATIIGVILGGLAGYFGGAVDLIIMRISEVVGGLPFIPFAMILSAVIGSRLDPTQRMYLIMIVLGVLSWVGTCRLVRAQFFAQREMEYVTAAKAMGIRAVSYTHLDVYKRQALLQHIHHSHSRLAPGIRTDGVLGLRRCDHRRKNQKVISCAQLT